jgi:hypothetical protein
LDPFNSDVLHEHVYCYITQHLTGEDLLKISEVSTSWNEIAENQNIGDKVLLYIDLYSMTDKDLKIIEESSREYKTVWMELMVDERYHTFWEWRQDFQQVVWSYKHDRDFKLFCKNFSEIQENLENHLIDYDSWLEENENLDKIEDLTLNLIYGELPWNYEEYYDDDTHGALHFFIAQLENLKHLDLCNTHASFLKSYRWESLLQLKSLTGALYYNCPFLKSQRKFLRTICDTSVYNGYLKVHRYLKLFPKLTKLEMKHEKENSWYDYHSDDEDKQFYDDNYVLPINMKIKHLKLRDFKHFPDDLYSRGMHSSEILTALPALVSLDIGQLTLRLIEFVARNMQVLKKLRYETVEDGALARYEGMKLEEDEGINTNIECIQI